MLKILHLHVLYGPVPALLDASLTVPDGKIVAVLGANGAGKSSLLRAISGVARDVQGLIELDGQVILRKGLGQMKALDRHLRSDQVVKLGVAHVPEGRQVFPDLSVRENLYLGGYLRTRQEAAANVEEVLALFPALQKKLGRPANTLSGGEQQMLAIARALVGRPRLLMLDEPSVGLSPQLVVQVFELISTIRERWRCSVLLVEQNVNAALDVADHGYVLETPGHIVVDGTAKELRENDTVRKAYLGR